MRKRTRAVQTRVVQGSALYHEFRIMTSYTYSEFNARCQLYLNNVCPSIYFYESKSELIKNENQWFRWYPGTAELRQRLKGEWLGPLVGPDLPDSQKKKWHLRARDASGHEVSGGAGAGARARFFHEQDARRTHLNYYWWGFFFTNNHQLLRSPLLITLLLITANTERLLQARRGSKHVTSHDSSFARSNPVMCVLVTPIP